MAGRNAREPMTVVNEGGKELSTHPKLTFEVAIQWPSYSWASFPFFGPQLSTTVSHPTRNAGFVGFGRIAHATLAHLIPFGFIQCLYFSSPSSPAKLFRDASLATSLNLTLDSIRRVNLAIVAEESDVVFVLQGEGNEYLCGRGILEEDEENKHVNKDEQGKCCGFERVVSRSARRMDIGRRTGCSCGRAEDTCDHPSVREAKYIYFRVNKRNLPVDNRRFTT